MVVIFQKKKLTLLKKKRKFETGMRVSVKYEDGEDYKGIIVKVLKNAVDVQFDVDNSIARIKKNQYKLITILKDHHLQVVGRQKNIKNLENL